MQETFRGQPRCIKGNAKEKDQDYGYEPFHRKIVSHTLMADNDGNDEKYRIVKEETGHPTWPISPVSI